MKLNTLSLVIALISLAFSGYLLIRINSIQGEKEPVAKTESTEKISGEAQHEHSESVEIVHYMRRIQVFHTKLFYSGVENNTNLIKFYSHELKEEMETIADGDIFDEGINISENMKLWGIRNINKFTEEISQPDFNFKNSYSLLTSACNSCHQATGHPYILITEPPVPNPYNQDFKSLK